jgi:DNA-binding beta-propeller fold protein YncE
MHMRYVRCLYLFGLLSLVTLCSWAVEPKNELYVLNVKPPSVAVVPADTLKIAAEIPLVGEPSFALADRANRYLYVLVDGVYRANGLMKPGLGKLAVVDLISRTLLKTIPLAWNTKNVALTKNGRYLVCVSAGKGISKKNAPEEHGSITIVDTTTNEAVATLSAGRLGVDVAYNSDLSRIAVFSRGEAPRKKGAAYTKPLVTLFTLAQEQPLAEIELDRASAITLSPDEQWLYVLDRGVPSRKPAEYKSGLVHVIDFQSAKLVKSHEVGSDPKELSVDPDSGAVYVLASNTGKAPGGRLVRLRGAEMDEVCQTGRGPQFVRGFGSHAGSFVVSQEELRQVPESGPAGNAFVALNPRKGAGAEPTEGVTLGGNVPGETLYLPKQRKLVAVMQSILGAPTSKIAIVDLSGNRVEHVVTTGRGSVKFGKFVGAMALSVAMSSLSYYGSYSIASSTGQPFFFYNIYTFSPAPPNLELAASADEQFVYVLNTSTNDVTIVKVADGTVIDKIAVGGGCRRVALAPGGKFIYSYTSGQFDLIDVATNKKLLEHKLDSGKINALSVLERDKRIATLTSNSVLLWDVETGAQAGTIEGLHQPYLLVQSSRGEM